MLTKEQLEDFREKLIKRKDKVILNIREIENDIVNIRDKDIHDEGDDASIFTETNLDNAIMEQLHKELKEIELSLDKIKNGLYGICEMCEEPIGIKRLKVKNFARFCITCREINEKTK
ncbi:C4-type zinc finger protein, DksA/TraR family [hydrothermal vent metagenome]|uniref:C4-type zinc finger protein, DksA/TraR family n=1 Tax=hydrothermal vent metagenome TaxID=652676 RepID=A0A1W1ELC9_9ZZZZ